MNENEILEHEKLARHIYQRFFAETFPTPEKLHSAQACGMLAKRQLYDGRTYIGFCHNAIRGKWDALQQRFIIERTKFGHTFEETICHPEDEARYDVFVPVCEVEDVREQRKNKSRW